MQPSLLNHTHTAHLVSHYRDYSIITATCKGEWLSLHDFCVLLVIHNINPNQLTLIFIFAMPLPQQGTPKFVVKPENRVAVRGRVVNFTCSTISSPRPTRIKWMVRGDTVESSGRYSIATDRSAVQDGSNITVSTLIIGDVNGFDSGSVECEVTYSSADLSELNSILSVAQLAVLGEWLGEASSKFLIKFPFTS